jgi:hypothetical protein
VVYPQEGAGGLWRATFTEDGVRRFRQAVTEAELAVKLAKVIERGGRQAGKPGTNPGNAASQLTDTTHDYMLAQQGPGRPKTSLCGLSITQLAPSLSLSWRLQVSSSSPIPGLWVNEHDGSYRRHRLFAGLRRMSHERCHTRGRAER